MAASAVCMRAEKGAWGSFEYGLFAHLARRAWGQGGNAGLKERLLGAKRVLLRISAKPGSLSLPFSLHLRDDYWKFPW